MRVPAAQPSSKAKLQRSMLPKLFEPGGGNVGFGVSFEGLGFWDGKLRRQSIYEGKQRC